MGYKRTDDLLLSMGANEGTSNTMLEGDNERANEEGDVSGEGGVANANKEEESEPEPIRQRGPNVS